MAADVVIRDEPAEGRFVAQLGNQAASAWYTRSERALRFERVDISHELQACGVGTQLVRVALARARENGLLVEPACDLFVDYMRRNPETQDLLTSDGWRLVRL
ncbi:MAG TPA: N-acetyltransferase [Luteibacter sp.]|uniref:GNAT family N-acetyltransferase n=1 Tax=Luteibacter sp. TaxID=1886636 RepID=UPI002C84CA25|nr:N-acetyltransferase [Luteibacter sp.]HVI56009.1 N-acetyltransferase [Luteibacter sp.]